MRLLGILPINRLEQVKSRLAEVLPDRAPLALCLLRHVAGALLASGCLERLVVVSPDPRVEETALECGALFLAQQGDGLNPALEQARALHSGFEGVLVVLGDLPELQGPQVQEMVAMLANHSVVLAPDAEERGTNLLLCAPAGALPFQFGVDSLAAHQREAHRQGLEVRLYRSPGTARDLDTPEQWRELQWSS